MARKTGSYDPLVPASHFAPKTLIRKRTVALHLAVIGAAAAGLHVLEGKDVQRNSYASQEDCEHDYATGQCTREESAGGGGSGGHYRYQGPWYRSDWTYGPFRGDPGPGRSSASGVMVPGHGPVGFDFGHRGGFGSRGRVSARGG